MEQERRQLSKEDLDKMEAEQMPSDEAMAAESGEFDKFQEKQTEKFADAANIEAILNGFDLNGFESSKSKQTQKEFIEGFNSIGSQLKPYFEKYGVLEPACFKDIKAGDTLREVYYDVKLAGYGLLREKMSR